MAHNRNIESPRNDLSNSPSFDILYIDHNSSKLLCLSNAVITDKSSSPILTYEPSICNLDDSDLSRKSPTNSENVKYFFSDKTRITCAPHIACNEKLHYRIIGNFKKRWSHRASKKYSNFIKSANYKEKKIKRMKNHCDKEYDH